MVLIINNSNLLIMWKTICFYVFDSRSIEENDNAAPLGGEIFSSLLVAR